MRHKLLGVKVAVFADRSPAPVGEHVEARLVQLRNAGFDVEEAGSSKRDPALAEAQVVCAIGPGCWRRARRAARRAGVALVYDHPRAAAAPGRLHAAGAVIAAGYSDALQFAGESRQRPEPVVVPLVEATGAVPGPSLRSMIRRDADGVHTGELVVSEVAGLPERAAQLLLVALASFEGLDLAVLGGEGWAARERLEKTADRLDLSARLHFPPAPPASLRAAWLAEADIGLTLATPEQEGIRSAVDLFSALGVPFIAATGALRGAAPPGCVPVGSDDDRALRRAITAARGEAKRTVQEPGQILEELFASVAANGEAPKGKFAAGAREQVRKGVGQLAIGATEGRGALALRRANDLRDAGDREAAVALYSEIAFGHHPLPTIAAAATALAGLGHNAEAERALESVTGSADVSALALARAAEAAAALGDLGHARRLAEDALARPDADGTAMGSALRALEQAGEFNRALETARECGDEQSVQRLEGTLTSLDPTWLPGGPSSQTVSRPPAPKPGRLFTILETSLPQVRSGYTYRARTLLRAQRQAGLDPVALTRLGFPANRRLTAPASEQVDGVVHHRKVLPGVTRYTAVPMTEQLNENLRWAEALGRELRPSAVIATTPHLNGFVGLALKDRLEVPLVYDVRGFPEMTWAVRPGGQESAAYQLRRQAETRCMREADRVTTLSEAMKRQIVDRGIAPERVFVLPHAVDLDTFKPAPPDRELAERLGLSGRTVVGYISSLVAYEGVETLLEAIAVARESDPAVAGLIVGDGILMPSLKERATELGLAEHVVFTGRIDADKVPAYYSLTDIFVCPRDDHEVTRFVTPLKPFEAMAAGCCLVVSDLPVLSEAVRDGECGATFSPGDPQDLAATILELAADPARRDQLAAAAVDHVGRSHGIDSLREAIASLWDSLDLMR